MPPMGLYLNAWASESGTTGEELGDTTLYRIDEDLLEEVHYWWLALVFWKQKPGPMALSSSCCMQI